MKSYSAEAIRNICLLSHGGVGKTTLLEAMTFTTKATNRIGRTDAGNSMYDTREDEKQRKMTIGLKTSFIEWKDKKINTIDTSGFIEFITEAKVALKVVECTVVLVDAMDGIQVGTELVSGYIEEAALPKIFFINKIDKENANFSNVVKMLNDTYGTSAAPIQMPIGEGENVKGIINLISMEAFTYQKGGSGIGTKTEIPNELKDKAKELRNKLVEAVAESDEALMNKFFESGELAQVELMSGLLKGIRAGAIFPVLCGSALNNIGTDIFLDAVCELCPPASNIKEIKTIGTDNKETTTATGDNQPLVAFVYKTFSDEHMGAISFLRIFSGSIKSGDEILNVSTDTYERIGSIYAMRGLNRTDLDKALAGDMCATLKLKNTHTCNTFADKNRQVKIPGITFPSPLVQKAIYPKSKGDEEKLSIGLNRLREEDPTFHYGYDSDILQTIIAGMGDVHIDVLINSLFKRFNVSTDLRKPRIPYRETIKTKADAKYRHKKQSGGAGQFAEVWLRIEPKSHGAGIEFINSLVGQNVDRSFVPSVEKGVLSACTEGVLCGYRIVDVKIDFYDGKMHPVDSKDIAFQIAGKHAFREAFLNAKPCLLEPVYDIEVTVPEEYTGDIMGDLSSRRGKISGMNIKGKSQNISAKIPLVDLSDYMPTLRSITQGRGYYTRKFSHYDEVSSEVAGKLIESIKKERELEAAEKEKA